MRDGMGDVLARTARVVSRHGRRDDARAVSGVNLTRLDTEKLLPQNVEAEASVLGSLLIDPDAMSLIADFLRPEDFYREAHRVIYQVMADLYDAHTPADLIILIDELQRRGALEDIGGASYVSSLANQVPTSANLESYARIVTRTATLRRLIHAAGQIAGVAYNESDAHVALESAERLIREVADQAARSDDRAGPRLLKEPLGDWLNAFALAMAAEETGLLTDDVETAQASVARVSTGFRFLDNMLRGGLRRGALISIGATPGQGKTALALSIGANVARSGGRVLMFSLEMTLDELLSRLISQVSGVPQDVLQQPQRGVTGEQMGAIGDAIGAISDWTFLVDDTPALSIGDLAARARQASIRYSAQDGGSIGGLDLIIVDYLQLVKGGGLSDSGAPRRGDTREQEVSDVAKGLKALAKLLNVPVLALAQVNDKQVEGRADKRPLGSDFRESSAIYHDSDVAAFLYRDHKYNPDTSEPGTTELIIRKHRGGPEGTCGLWFDAPRTRFVGLSTDQTTGSGDVR
jgi:replicative DNA helicase